MGKTLAKKILDLLKKNGGSLSRDAFRKYCILEIGTDSRTVKNINATLRQLKNIRMIDYDENGIRLLEND